MVCNVSSWNIEESWRNSTDGCPLWTAIARLPEVQLTWILFLWLANAQLMIWGFWIFAKLHSRPEICAFENGLTKSVTFASMLRQIWRVPSLNGHNSARRGAIDPGPFSTARGFPADDLRHWKCLKSPFQAWLIRVQSSHTIWYFWAIFGRTSSFYWFSLFSLPLSRFWPISFEPPLENPRLRPVGLGPSGFCRPTDLRLGFSRGVINSATVYNILEESWNFVWALE